MACSTCTVNYSLVAKQGMFKVIGQTFPEAPNKLYLKIGRVLGQFLASNSIFREGGTLFLG